MRNDVIFHTFDIYMSYRLEIYLINTNSKETIVHQDSIIFSGCSITFKIIISELIHFGIFIQYVTMLNHHITEQ